MSKFQPTVLGITAFMEANRLDFRLEGPKMEEPKRASLYYAKPETKKQKKARKKARMLDGEPVKLVEIVREKKTDNVTAIVIKWGDRTVKLGRRTQAAGKPSFYRSLEPSNSSAIPESPEEIIDALNLLLAQSL